MLDLPNTIIEECKANGGSTVWTRTEMQHTGYLVGSLNHEASIKFDESHAVLRDFICVYLTRNSYFGDAIGAWIDDEGLMVMDVVTYYDDLDKAIEAGCKDCQHSIYDIENRTTIPVDVDGYYERLFKSGYGC